MLVDAISMPTYSLKPGMVLVEDVMYRDKALVSKGTELTSGVIERLMLFGIGLVRVEATKEVHEVLNNEVLKKPAAQVKAEESIHYLALKENVKNALIDLSKNGVLNDNLVQDAAAEIAKNSGVDQIQNIFDSINGIRTVDEYLYTHSVDVALLNVVFGYWLKLSDEEVHELLIVGLLHDIGKTQLDSKILYRPSDLSPAEFEHIKTHSELSVKLAKDHKGVNDRILAGIIEHHERMNGTGYPYGLYGDQISLYGRITAITDIYSAMVSSRVHKDRQTPFAVFDMFNLNRFGGLDIILVNKFLLAVSSTYIGEFVKLSDGRIGKVVFINSNDYTKPFIEVDDDVINLSSRKDIDIVEVIKN